MFFLNTSFVYIKVRVMFDLEFIDIFFKTNTKKCINSNNTWSCYDTLTHKIVAFEMRIKQVFSNPLKAWKFQAFSAVALVMLNARRIINFKINSNNNTVIVIVKVAVMMIMWRWLQLC